MDSVLCTEIRSACVSAETKRATLKSMPQVGSAPYAALVMMHESMKIDRKTHEQTDSSARGPRYWFPAPVTGRMAVASADVSRANESWQGAWPCINPALLPAGLPMECRRTQESWRGRWKDRDPNGNWAVATWGGPCAASVSSSCLHTSRTSPRRAPREPLQLGDAARIWACLELRTVTSALCGPAGDQAVRARNRTRHLIRFVDL